MNCYRASAFINPNADKHGNHSVISYVTWTWQGGDSANVTGEFFSAKSPTGPITLGHLGLHVAAACLDLPHEWFTDEFSDDIAGLLTRAIAAAPFAEVSCPHGTLTVELMCNLMPPHRDNAA